ncbi:MAG: hypothetical protein ACO27R_03965 [Hylemonella sp.]
MPRVNLTIPPDLLDRIDAAKPNFLDRKSFLCLLISEQLDKPDTLGGPSEAGTPSNTSSITSNKNNKSVVCEVEAEPENTPAEAQVETGKRRKARSKPVEGCPEFELFWKQYLALKHRANGQTKPAAVAAWRKVTKEITPQQLRSALTAAVNHQAKSQRENGWAAPFPDCHRWLTKGYWQQFVDACSPVEAPLVARPIFDPSNPDAPF